MSEEELKYVQSIERCIHSIHDVVKHHHEWITEIEKENDQRYKNVRWMINYIAFFAFITFVMVCFK